MLDADFLAIASEAELYACARDLMLDRSRRLPEIAPHTEAIAKIISESRLKRLRLASRMELASKAAFAMRALEAQERRSKGNQIFAFLGLSFKGPRELAYDALFNPFRDELLAIAAEQMRRKIV